MALVPLGVARGVLLNSGCGTGAASRARVGEGSGDADASSPESGGRLGSQEDGAWGWGRGAAFLTSPRAVSAQRSTQTMRYRTRHVESK